MEDLSIKSPTQSIRIELKWRLIRPIYYTCTRYFMYFISHRLKLCHTKAGSLLPVSYNDLPDCGQDFVYTGKGGDATFCMPYNSRQDHKSLHPTSEQSRVTRRVYVDFERFWFIIIFHLTLSRNFTLIMSTLWSGIATLCHV